jgi:hypothetical protein
MDNRQIRIFKNICEKNDIPFNNTFKQFRNLKEFRCFMIERINPAHHILLFGKLKKPIDGNYNRMIKVGEILLCMSCFIFIPSFLLEICINVIGSFILFNLLLELIFNVDRDRGKCWYRKNAVHGSLLG